MIWLKRVLVILLVMTMPLIVAGVLVSTSYGSKLILIFAGQMSGSASIGELEGNLLGPLILRKVKFRNENTSITVGKLALTWRPDALWDSTLHITNIELEELVIKQLKKDDSDQPIKLPKFELPIDIILDNIRIADINFFPLAQPTPIAVQQILLTAHYTSQTLHINKLQVDAEHAHAALTGTLQPSNNYATNVTMSWQAQPPNYAALEGTLKVLGDLKHIELDHQFAAPINTSMTASIDSVLELGHWQATLRTENLDPAKLHMQWPSARINGAITAQGDRRQAQLAINGLADYQQYSVKIDSRAHYQAPLWQLDQLQLSLPATNTTVNTRGTIAVNKSLLQLKLNGEWRNAVWPITDAPPQVTSKQGRFTLEGTPDQYKVAVDGLLLGEKFPMLNLSLRGKGSTRALQLTAFQAKVNGSDLRAQGDIAWQPKFLVNLKGQWQNLVWPLTGTAVATSPQGRVHVEGDMLAYRFNLQGLLATPNAPTSSWSLSGLGDKTSAKATAQTSVLEGKIDSSVQLSWTPTLRWDVSSQAQNLNPGTLWPKWPGQLGFQATSQGTVDQGALNASLDVSRLSGQLRDQTVSGKIHATARGETYELAPLAINIGSAQLTASGSLKDQWDIKWATDIPALGVVLSEIKGSWLAQGTVSGPRHAPRVIATANAQNVVAGKYRVGKLDGAADIDLRGATISSINVRANDLVANDTTKITELRINAKGLTQDHNLSITADTPLGNIAIQAKGGYSAGAWTGSLEKGLAALPVAGQWRLASPFDIYLSQQELHIGSLCWDQVKAQGRLCGETDWSSEQGWQGEAQAINVPLNLVDSLLPLDTNLFGLVDGNATLQTINHRATANFQMTSTTGSLVYRSGTDQAVAMGYTNAAVIGQLADGVLTTTFSVPLQDNDDLAGKLVVDIEKAEQTISGELHAQLTHFALLPAFFPAIEEPEASLFVDIQVTGTLKAPRFLANVELNKGSASIPKQGLALRDIGIKLSTLENGHFALRGAMRSGAGDLRIQGDINPFSEGGWTAEFTVAGERFQALDIPEYEIALSPDLTIDIAPYKVKINGTIAIPDAKLRPRSGRGAVSVSKDVIVEGQISNGGKRRWEVESIVRFELGEKVKFEGFGLTGRLTGTLVIIDTPQRLTNALGEIRIEGGRYQAYGQDLGIERGRLLFVGGPIDDPGIDVRAVRKVEDVTAGLNVRGPLRSPTVSIFSTPPMSDQNALAYLLLGRPVSQASANEGLQLYKAAASLGFKGGEILAKQLGDRFGIDDVSLESGGQFDEPTLLIGKYLSPRLYIGYGIGLINQLNSIRLRYRLSKMWTLEADSGRTTGADLLYTLESN